MTETPRLSPSQQLLRYFEFKHLPDHLQIISAHLQQAAFSMETLLPDGPEKTAGMRKLLEAKDCFVRAMLPEETK